MDYITCLHCKQNKNEYQFLKTNYRYDMVSKICKDCRKSNIRSLMCKL